MARTKKPALVVVEPVHARAVRGPHKDDPHRFYWRAEVHQADGSSLTVWTGWLAREEVTPKLIALIQEGKLEAKGEEDAPIETVRDLLETWVHEQEQRSDLSETWRRSARCSGSRLCTAIGTERLEHLNRSTLEGYRNRALRTEQNPNGIATATCLQDLKMFRAAWAWGRELGFVPDTPLPRVSVKVVGVKDKRTPTRDEIGKVLEQLDEGWPRLAVQLLVVTGARIGEVARLTWGDLDLELGTLTIRKGKTGGRTVPIGAGIVSELRRWMPRDRQPLPTEGIFGVSWKLIRSKLGTGPLERACEDAGVPKFTPHGLRRAAVDAFRRSGVDVKTAATFLGQSDVVMLAYYAQATEDDKRRALTVARLDVDLDTALELDPDLDGGADLEAELGHETDPAGEVEAVTNPAPSPDGSNREEPGESREETPTVTASGTYPAQLPRTKGIPRNTKPRPRHSRDGAGGAPKRSLIEED